MPHKQLKNETTGKKIVIHIRFGQECGYKEKGKDITFKAILKLVAIGFGFQVNMLGGVTAGAWGLYLYINNCC